MPFELSLFEQMSADRFEESLENLGALSGVKVDATAAEAGLLEIVDHGNYLYISRSDDLRAVLKEFTCGSSLALLSNHFWAPDPNALDVRIYRGTNFDDVNLYRWQLKLIQEREPVFNWPVIAA